MRKYLAVLFIALILISFVSCGKDSTIPTTVIPTDAYSQPETTQAIHVHYFSQATCIKAPTCSCGAVSGTVAEHNYDYSGVCINCGAVTAELTEEVSFGDLFLESAVKKELDITDRKITKYDMLALEDIRIENPVTDLSGLEYAKNLETIHIGTKDITDYSPLYNLEKLKNVYIGILLEGIDVSFLENLSRVEYLYIISEPTSDSYKYLISSPVLREMCFSVDWNEDISFLRGANSLEKLTLSCHMTEEMDISVLLELPNLKELEVGSYTSHGIDMPQNHKSIYEELLRKNVIVSIG